MRLITQTGLLRTAVLLSAVTVLFQMLSFNAVAQTRDESQLGLKTVVIDPGHGGKDAGCISRDRKTYEKNLTLAISKLLGDKISRAYPDVRVIYTRTTDKYLTLNERAEIANRNHADLFISIHINSFTSSSPNGFSAHILGQSSNRNRDLFSYNIDVCRRENSVILLEEDYTTQYQGFDPNDPESFIFLNLMQNAYYEQSLLFAADVEYELSKGPITHSRGISQDPFYVLWKTSMPAVLLEMGFMSNPSDLKTMNSAAGKEEMASRLLDAFRRFKNRYDSTEYVLPYRQLFLADAQIEICKNIDKKYRGYDESDHAVKHNIKDGAYQRNNEKPRYSRILSCIGIWFLLDSDKQETNKHEYGEDQRQKHSARISSYFISDHLAVTA